MRCPMNFPPSSNAAILREARVGRITCHRPWSQTLMHRPRQAEILLHDLVSLLPLTFLKTIGSSSHTGLMALLFWEVLVFRAFLRVSAGSPNISTSMYTPTRRSVRNWPEITWGTQTQTSVQDQLELRRHKTTKTSEELLHLHRECVGHNAVHRVFCKGVEVFVRPSHELRLQSVAAAAVVLKHEEVELHGQIWSRKSELTSGWREGCEETDTLIWPMLQISEACIKHSDAFSAYEICKTV